MKQRAFKIVAVVSLAVCVAACVLWERSYRVYEGRSYPINGSVLQVSHCRGELRVMWCGDSPGPVVDRSFSHRLTVRVTEPGTGLYKDVAVDVNWDRVWRYLGRTGTTRRAAGFGIGWGQAGVGAAGLYVRVVQAPYAAVAVLSCVSALGSVASVTRRRRRRTRGFCLTCGYDLRVSNERCPERGAAITTAERNAENR